MNQNEWKDHEYQCGSKTIKCEYCGENVTKITYDLHLEYTCEKFNKNNNKDDKDNNNIAGDINKIINKNKKEKNVNKNNGNKKMIKKGKDQIVKIMMKKILKHKKRNIINFIVWLIFWWFYIFINIILYNIYLFFNKINIFDDLINYNY